MKTLADIKRIIEETGLTKCKSQDCDACEFDKKSPESRELGNVNICILLNEVYQTK